MISDSKECPGYVRTPRRFVSHLRRFIGNRRRHQTCARAPELHPQSLGSPVEFKRHTTVAVADGHTLDISTTGVALIVPAIRIGEHYLAGADRAATLKLDLPGGPVEMKLATVRYEALEETDEETGYLIGARIIEMADADRASFEEYIAKMSQPS